MKINERINELRLKRGWSVNNLALEAGLTQSTLNSLLLRESSPRVETLISICNAFNISLAQFFIEDEKLEMLSDDEKKLIEAFRRLTPEKQRYLLGLLL